MKDIGQGMGVGAWHHPRTSTELQVFTNPEALQTSCFWVLMEASLSGHGWLNHLLLVIINSPSIPSPFPGGQGLGLKGLTF